jgi:hypothetical protein
MPNGAVDRFAVRAHKDAFICGHLPFFAGICEPLAFGGSVSASPPGAFSLRRGRATAPGPGEIVNLPPLVLAKS